MPNYNYGIFKWNAASVFLQKVLWIDNFYTVVKRILELPSFVWVNVNWILEFTLTMDNNPKRQF